MSNKEVEFFETIKKIEKSQESDRIIFESIVRRADTALKSKDTKLFQMLSSGILQKDEREVMIRHTALLRFDEIIQTSTIEKEGGVKLFISDTNSFSELMEKYERVNMYLRRIELDIDSGLNEAYTFIREYEISTYAIAGILYHRTSRIGHRETVLMKLAEDSLDHGDFLRAYAFLIAVREPSKEVVALKKDLEQAIEGFEMLSL